MQRKNFRIITDFFEKEKIEYAVIGAMALHAYGYTRATVDIDFIVKFQEQSKIIDFLESLGFETINKSEGFSNHVLAIGPTRFDFVYVDEKTAEVLMEKVSLKKLSNGELLPVVCPEHLIALKLHTIRNDPDRIYRELADIKEIAKRVKLDLKLLKRSEFESLDLGHFFDIHIALTDTQKDHKNESEKY